MSEFAQEQAEFSQSIPRRPLTEYEKRCLAEEAGDRAERAPRENVTVIKSAAVIRIEAMNEVLRRFGLTHEAAEF